MVSDAVALSITSVLGVLISTIGAVIIAMLKRNHAQGEEIHGMVNGELTRLRTENQFLRRQLRVLAELGIVPADAPDDLVDRLRRGGVDAG